MLLYVAPADLELRCVLSPPLLGVCTLTLGWRASRVLRVELEVFGLQGKALPCLLLNKKTYW